MRYGGVYITQTTGDDDASKLGARLLKGRARFADSLWGRHREIIINLGDVSAIELFDADGQEALKDG